MKFLALVVLLSVSLFSQTKSPITATLKVTVQYDDPYQAGSSSTMILSGDGISLPPNSAGRFEGEVELSEEGWFLGYSSLGHSSDLNSKNISYTVSNAGRRDLLCPGRNEILLGSPGPQWPDSEGYGYHLRAGDKLRFSVQVRNTNAAPIKDGDIGVVIKFQSIHASPFLSDAYPMWFNTRGCGPAEFDLKPGRNISSGTFEIPLTGTLAALQSALGANAEYIDVGNRTREKQFLHQFLHTGEGYPLILDVVTPRPGTEFRVDEGDFVAIAAGYNNPQAKEAKGAGIGVVLGLFVPVDEAKMAQFTNKKGSATVTTTAGASQN